MKTTLTAIMITLFAATLQSPDVYAYEGLNTIPYLQSFESFAPNYPITNELGWTATDASLYAIVTNIADHGKSSPYLTGETHTNVLDIAGTVSNTFSPDGQDGMEFIYVDVLIKPQARMHYPSQYPPSDNSFDRQGPLTVAWVNTNNQLVFYHKWLTPDPYDFRLVWTTNEVDEVLTNAWNRLTFKLAYRCDPEWMDAWFQLQVNGGAPYSNSVVGYSTNQLGVFIGGVPDGGTWFWAANSVAGQESFLSLGYLSVEGIAQLDDLVITDTEPSGPSAYTTNGTPVAWLNVFSLVTNGVDNADNSDTDQDGMLAWQEYRAGTIPTDSSSVFKIVALRSTGTNLVTFLGGTNEDNVPFVVYRATNLMDPTPWFAPEEYSRLNGVDGTNIWQDTIFALSNYPAIFYKIEAPSTNP